MARGIVGWQPKVVLDPAAGDGALLVALASKFPIARMLAMDIDKGAARRLREKMPNCIVSVCDALAHRSIGRSRVWGFRDRVDLVVANPPFGDRRSAMVLTVNAWGEHVRCGVAAAHVLSAAACFSPERMVVVVPDSFLYSQRDADALRLLRRRYFVRVLRSLGNRAFSGTGASVSLIELSQEGERTPKPYVRRARTRLEVDAIELIRGGVPMHEAHDVSEGGLPLLHTTNILAIGTQPKRTVKRSRRGVISGPVILLPRVGLPSRRHLVPASLGEHQLSDCVVAVRCQSDEAAAVVSRHLHKHFDRLRSCWRGTGAQYTTLKKLRDCLDVLGVPVQTHRPADPAFFHNGDGVTSETAAAI